MELKPMSNKRAEGGNHRENVVIRLKEIMPAERMTAGSHKSRLNDKIKNIEKDTILKKTKLEDKEPEVDA